MATMIVFTSPPTVDMGHGWKLRAIAGRYGPHGLEAVVELLDPHDVVQDTRLVPYGDLYPSPSTASSSSLSQKGT